MPTSKAGRSTDAGFTLIELAIVVFLIALFSAIVIPRLPSLESGGGERAARRISGTVKALYNEAALSGGEQRLIFDLEKGEMQPRRLKASGELENARGFGEKVSLSGAKILDIRVAGQDKVATGTATVPFSPAGWLPETVIHLDSDGRVLTLRLFSFTGSTRVYDGYREF